jgi:hypothetical protein
LSRYAPFGAEICDSQRKPRLQQRQAAKRA